MAIASAACIVEIGGKRILWPCHRHADALVVFQQMWEPGYAKVVEQGFMDEKRQFMTREQAYAVSVANGQLKRGDGGYQGGELFSEDLW